MAAKNAVPSAAVWMRCFCLSGAGSRSYEAHAAAKQQSTYQPHPNESGDVGQFLAFTPAVRWECNPRPGAGYLRTPFG